MSTESSPCCSYQTLPNPAIINLDKRWLRFYVNLETQIHSTLWLPLIKLNGSKHSSNSTKFSGQTVLGVCKVPVSQISQFQGTYISKYPNFIGPKSQYHFLCQFNFGLYEQHLIRNIGLHQINIPNLASNIPISQLERKYPRKNDQYLAKICGLIKSYNLCRTSSNYIWPIPI